jgi:hypothetical protein
MNNYQFLGLLNVSYPKTDATNRKIQSTYYTRNMNTEKLNSRGILKITPKGRDNGGREEFLYTHLIRND